MYYPDIYLGGGWGKYEHPCQDTVPLIFQLNTSKMLLLKQLFFAEGILVSDITVFLFQTMAIRSHLVQSNPDISIIHYLFPFSLLQYLYNLPLSRLYLHLPRKCRQCDPPKLWFPHTILHGVMTLRTTVYTCLWNCSKCHQYSFTDSIFSNYVPPLWLGHVLSSQVEGKVLHHGCPNSGETLSHPLTFGELL